MPGKSKRDRLLTHWKKEVAEYVRVKRAESDKKQKQLPVARRTISDIDLNATGRAY